MAFKDYDTAASMADQNLLRLVSNQLKSVEFIYIAMTMHLILLVMMQLGM